MLGFNSSIVTLSERVSFRFAPWLTSRDCLGQTGVTGDWAGVSRRSSLESEFSSLALRVTTKKFSGRYSVE